MKNVLSLTGKEFEAIRTYADFMRHHVEPCDRKCGPPGSPDRRACCGCPDHGEWEKKIEEFKERHELTDDILKNDVVKRYIAAYDEHIRALLMLREAENRVAEAEEKYLSARDAFVIEEDE